MAIGMICDDSSHVVVITLKDVCIVCCCYLGEIELKWGALGIRQGCGDNGFYDVHKVVG